MSIQAHAALLSRLTERPVRLTLTREQSIRVHPKRHPIEMHYEVGCDADGKGGHPIDLCRYQVINNYMGRVPLINSGGASSGAGDLKEAVTTAVINKRAGGMGLISGRKAFQRPMKEGAALLNAIQDVYLDDSVTVA